MLIKVYDSLNPAKAPSADGIGKTINLPKSVTYFGLFTILHKNY